MINTYINYSKLIQIETNFNSYKFFPKRTKNIRVITKYKEIHIETLYSCPGLIAYPRLMR